MPSSQYISLHVRHSVNKHLSIDNLRHFSTRLGQQILSSCACKLYINLLLRMSTPPGALAELACFGWPACVANKLGWQRESHYVSTLLLTL